MRKGDPWRIIPYNRLLERQFHSLRRNCDAPVECQQLDGFTPLIRDVDIRKTNQNGNSEDKQCQQERCCNNVDHLPNHPPFSAPFDKRISCEVFDDGKIPKKKKNGCAEPQHTEAPIKHSRKCFRNLQRFSHSLGIFSEGNHIYDGETCNHS